MFRNLLVALGLTFSLLLCSTSSPYAKSEAKNLPLKEIRQIITQHSFLLDESIDLADYFQHIRNIEDLRIFLKDLDPYATYTTSAEVSKLTKLTQNKSRGIGMDIFQDRSGKVRCVPFPNSEAGLAGIRYGDELQVVDNLEAKDSSLTELAQKICGSGKREVELQVQSPKKPPRNLLVPCQKIGKAPSVVMEYQGPRQIIHILRFGPETQKELLAHLKSLKDDQEIFLDLRGNTGGNLKVGLECAKLFLPKGRIILRRVSKSGAKSEINPKEGYWSYSYLHLRQDRYTASAAEMFIAALVSAKRGTSFGETSAGKAYVQDLFTLKDGSILKITTEKMLYPTKEVDWESQGLRPSASRP